VRKKFSLLYDGKLRNTIPIVKSALKRSTDVLKPKTNITFVIVPTSSYFVKNKMKGVAGFTRDENLVVLEVHTGGKWKEGLISTVAHEFSHTVRVKKFKYATLRESLASEGLAQNFEALISDKLQPWSKALPKNKIEKVANKMKPYLNDRSYKTYCRIFLSNHDKVFPHWSGYAVSYVLTKNQLKNLKIDWNKAFMTHSKELIKL
jgi:uncharacterized protein YjaZ